MTPQRFAILTIVQIKTVAGYRIIVRTDVPCHLWMRWTAIPPGIHKIPVLRRGIYLHADIRLCFVVYEDNEQEEAGDTIIHTFIKEPWPVCETRWFMFWGTINGVESPSTSGLFSKHRTVPIVGPNPWYGFPPDCNIGNDIWLARWSSQPFPVAQTHIIDSIALFLYRRDSTWPPPPAPDPNPGTCIVSIRACMPDITHLPTGPDLTSSEFDGHEAHLNETGNCDDGAWFEIPLTPATLEAGKNYCIVLRAPDAIHPTDWLGWTARELDELYEECYIATLCRQGFSHDSGETWFNIRRCQFFKEFGYT